MSADKQVLLPDKYQVVPRVLVFALDDTRKILLLKGAPTKRIYPNKWNGTGGHQEAGETPLQAARREFYEETGLTAKHMQPVGLLQINTGTNPGISVMVFVATEISGQLAESLEGSLEWKTLEEALASDLVEDLFTILPVVLDCFSKGSFFWANYHYDSGEQLIIDLELSASLYFL